MADNYLENRMEEYRSGRLARHSRSTASMRSPRKDNQLVISYPSMTVLIISDVIDGFVSETVAAFCRVGCRVALLTDDYKVGKEVAQSTGARYYPSSYSIRSAIEDIYSHWGVEPEVVVDFCGVKESQSISLAFHRKIDGLYWRNRVQSPSLGARHILYLSHPDNAFLLES